MLHFTKDDDAVARFSLELLHGKKHARKLTQARGDMKWYLRK